MNTFLIMTHTKSSGLPFNSVIEMCYCIKSMSNYVWIYLCMWEESYWVLLIYLNSMYENLIYGWKACNIGINGKPAWDLVMKINHKLLDFYEQPIPGNCLFSWFDMNIILSKQLNMSNAWLEYMVAVVFPILRITALTFPGTILWYLKGFV